MHLVFVWLLLFLQIAPFCRISPNPTRPWCHGTKYHGAVVPKCQDSFASQAIQDNCDAFSLGRPVTQNRPFWDRGAELPIYLENLLFTMLWLCCAGAEDTEISTLWAPNIDSMEPGHQNTPK